MTIVTSNLAVESYSECDVRAIIHDFEFAEVEYRPHQIGFFAHYPRETLHQEARVSKLARIVRVNLTRVARTLLRRAENFAFRGRHEDLDDESEAAAIASVLESFQAGKSLR
jgi:hypothetical protein